MVRCASDARHTGELPRMLECQKKEGGEAKKERDQPQGVWGGEDPRHGEESYLRGGDFKEGRWTLVLARGRTRKVGAPTRRPKRLRELAAFQGMESRNRT